MATPKITEKDIRIFMMDKPELNPLLRGVRWSPEEIDAALVHTVSMFNESPPNTGTYYTIEGFPWRYTLLLGAAGHLLRSASINEASNNLAYQLDGVSVNDKDKAEIFLKLGNQYWQEFKDQVTALKVQENLSMAFGSMESEHRILAR